MEKNFDKWNEVKKSTHFVGETVKAHQREIWRVSFGVNIGVEIDGKHNSYERSAIILRRFNDDMIWVVPVTSQKKKSPFYLEFILEGKTYWAALTQLRTVSTKRLLRKIGMIPKKNFADMQREIVELASKNERSPAQGGTSRRPKP